MDAKVAGRRQKEGGISKLCTHRQDPLEEQKDNEKRLAVPSSKSKVSVCISLGR